jgi:hypothetical protein
MPNAITSFLSPVENQMRVQALIQQESQTRSHHPAVEIIADHVEEILAQATQGQTNETPEFKEITENILRYVTYALFSENPSGLEAYLASLRETCIVQGISIYSISQIIPLMKSAAITCIKQHYSGNASSLLLAAYFDFVIAALEGVLSNDVCELISELNLTTSPAKRLQNLLERLSDLLDHSKQYVRIWLTSPHPDFGGKSPLFYLQQNKIEVVENLVEAIETGQIG